MKARQTKREYLSYKLRDKKRSPQLGAIIIPNDYSLWRFSGVILCIFIYFFGKIKDHYIMMIITKLDYG